MTTPAPTSTVTTHVLDAASGLPASGVHVVLSDAEGRVLGEGRTNADGRITDLGPTDLPPGVHRLRFDVAAHFATTGMASFYPEVTIAFTLEPGRRHVHVPLLLSPFAYSTYRGS